MLRDRDGNGISTASGAARDAYVAGCEAMLSSNLGATSALRRAVAEDAGFAAGHVALARAYQMAGKMAEARESLAAARGHLDGATDRERSQFGIYELLLGGDAMGALAAVRVHCQEWRRDTMALAPATGVFGLIGFSGLSGRERAQLDLLAPLEGAYGDDWWFLAALAFAEIEMGEVAAGRLHVDRALALNPRHASGAHISAHAHYEAGEGVAGSRFLAGWLEGYAPEAALHSHLNWHLALWAMQRGEMAEAWAIWERALRPAVCRGPAINVVTDAASFLFRMGLAGEAVDGALWAEVCAASARLFPQPGVSFIDLHAALAAAMAGDGEALARFGEGVRGPAGDLVAVAGRGFAAFARQDWAGVVREIGAVLGAHERFGGSRAQRDMLELTMAFALMRLGRGVEARRWMRAGSVHAE
jgi:hypothetical protein